MVFRRFHRRFLEDPSIFFRGRIETDRAQISRWLRDEKGEARVRKVRYDERDRAGDSVLDRHLRILNSAAVGAHERNT